MPEVKIISSEPLKVGCAASLLLKVTNPTNHEITFRLLSPDTAPRSDDSIATDDNKSLDKVCCTSSYLLVLS